MRAALTALAALLLTPACALAAPPDCEALLAYSEARSGVTLLVLQDGRVVCEAYAPRVAARTPLPLYSATKSLVALAAAAAVEDGLLSLEEPAAATLPEWRGDPIKSQVTLRQLLSMSSGLPSRIGDVPTYAEALDLPFNATPGERFQYGPAPYQAFGEIMRRKLAAKGLGEDPLAYLQRRVLQPAGARTAGWRRGDDGMPMMPQGAMMTARDFARLGEFVRTHRESYAGLFAPSPANPAYGVGWWLPNPGSGPSPATAASDLGQAAPRDLVMAAGAGDQRLYVAPSLKLTIVRQAPLRLTPAGPAQRWSDAEFVALATRVANNP